MSEEGILVKKQYKAITIAVQVFICTYVFQALAVVDATRQQNLRDAGIVDDDTIAYLPLDAIGGSAKADYPLDNYAFGAHKMDAIVDVSYANSVALVDVVFGEDCAVRGGWTNHSHVANNGAFMFRQQQGAADGLSGSVYLPDSERVITSDTFTFEGFYKWNTKPTTTHYFLARHTKNESGGNAFALNGLMLNSGKLRISALRGTYDVESGELVSTATVSGDTLYSCVDGRWHHIAVVYDRTAKTLKAYVDYRKILDASNFEMVTTKSKYQEAFMIGNGYYSNEKHANSDGGLDEVRITRRALSIKDFLFPEKYISTDTIAWVSFEDGDLGMWPYSCARQPSSTNNVIAISDDTIGGVGIRTKEKVPLRAGNVKSLSLVDGGGALIEYLNDPIVNNTTLNAVTMEFFAKGTAAYSYGLMVAIAGAAAGDSFTNNVMAVRIPNQSTTGNLGYYQGHFYDSEDNQRAGLYKNLDNPQNVTTDGAWHHVAVTFQQVGNKVVHTAYYDYKKVVENTASSSYLRSNLVHSALQIGHGISGCIDEIRISKGVLPVEKFLSLDKGRVGFVLSYR